MLEKLSHLSFAGALLSILVALVFSLFRNTTLAEHAGVATYVCMTFGVITMIIGELQHARTATKEGREVSHKKLMRRRSV